MHQSQAPRHRPVAPATSSSPATTAFGSNQARLDTIQHTSTDAVEVALPWSPGVDEGGPAPKDAGGPLDVLYSRTQPADATVDNVAHLSSGGTVSGNTRYVHVNVGSDLWLDIGSLSATDRARITTWLDNMYGEVHQDPATGKLVLGETRKSIRFSADTDDAQDVLDDANERDDTWEDASIWEFLNGGETVLEAKDADHTGYLEDQTKPGAWYNGYSLDADGNVSAHKSRFDQSENTAPVLDEAGIQRLIMSCLDVGDVKEALGDDKGLFKEGLQRRFGEGHDLGSGGLDWLADELWSYLHTGAGTDGEVDIGRLQAIVRAVSPDTKETAETNTPFDGPEFAVGDTERTLHRGDGVFGRATMLSLMHLLGDVSDVLTEPPEVGLVPTGSFDERDRFVNDRSGSMVGYAGHPGPWLDVKQAVDRSQGWTAANGMDSRKLGELDINDVQVGTTEANDISEALRRAYKTLHPKDKRQDQKAFAALFGLKRRDIFDRNGLNADSLRRFIGDGSGTGYGARGESGLKAMLMVLTHPELLPAGDPMRVHLEKGTGTPGEAPIRLNAVVDEEEQSLEYLEVVKALAAALSVDVRFVAVPTGRVPGNLVDQLIFVDLDDIHIDDSGNATIDYEQGGVEQRKTVEVDKVGSADSPSRYKGASLRLNNLQKVEGVSE